MAKIIVEIDIGGNHCPITPDSDWFPTADKSLISVDEAYLKRDPQEDSFYLFKVVSIQP